MRWISGKAVVIAEGDGSWETKEKPAQDDGKNVNHGKDADVSDKDDRDDKDADGDA